ncbi:MAG: hypothetical protein QFX32_02895 [Methanolinea sp.]|nr:hypothetical protein [Methanolinea sp.]
MKSYRHLRHVLVTMRTGHILRREPGLKTLIHVCERLGGKERED